MSIYIYNKYIYIYKCICRERERDRDVDHGGCLEENSPLLCTPRCASGRGARAYGAAHCAHRCSRGICSASCRCGPRRSGRCWYVVRTYRCIYNYLYCVCMIMYVRKYVSTVCTYVRRYVGRWPMTTLPGYPCSSIPVVFFIYSPAPWIRRSWGAHTLSLLVYIVNVSCDYSIHTYVRTYIHIYICYLFIYLFMYLFIYLSIFYLYVLIDLCIYLFVCVYVFIVSYCLLVFFSRSKHSNFTIR